MSHRDPKASLASKVHMLADQHALLRDEAQRAELGEALVRSQLGEALNNAISARLNAETATRAAVANHYHAISRAWEKPARRNRLRRLVERIMVRAGAVGATLIGRWAGKAALAPLFDHHGYVQEHKDVATSGISPLVHYLLYGAAAGYHPHPLFDEAFYRRTNAAELAATGLTSLEHFVRIGAGRGRDPHLLFQVDHYVAQVPELLETGENPLAHYIRVGADQDVSPHPLFQSTYYRSQVQSGERQVNPLIHYLTVGSARGLRPHPLFDPHWYRAHYGPTDPLEALCHFLIFAGHQLQSPGPWFDSAHYASARGDLRLPHIDPLSDYLAGGAWTTGQPRPGFHTTAYLVAHPEIAEQALAPLEHWARRAS